MNEFLIITIIMVLFNYVNSNNIRETSDKYKLDVTPMSFTFSIWGLIYILLFYI